jgi:hypothetical protein
MVFGRANPKTFVPIKLNLNSWIGIKSYWTTAGQNPAWYYNKNTSDIIKLTKMADFEYTGPEDLL